MNAREFEVIMKSEGLEMSQSVLIMLQEAKQHHQNIKRMTMYQHIPKIAEYIKKQLELKDKAIWEALGVAHLEKKYGFKLIEDRNEIIIATYQCKEPHSDIAQEIRNHVQIMMEIEKESKSFKDLQKYFEKAGR